jgi:radical SAM/CxCxxxxC motif protein YfkAB
MNLNQIHNPKPTCSPVMDPWDPIRSMQLAGQHRLTGIELTMTHLCNMRCEHCAVGDTLAMSEGIRIPLTDILKRLDEIEHLETLSITGGEPTYHEQTIREYIIPILKYAQNRGVYTQLNSNLTLDLSRYEQIAPYLDIMHISFNYRSAADFHQVGFVHTEHLVSLSLATKLYEQMISNVHALSRGGLFISAESMINVRTHTHLSEIHRFIVEMGCQRHEVHPMYPSAFAASLPMLSLEEMRIAISRLLDERRPDIWMLLGTLPFFACHEQQENQALLRRIWQEPNVTIRNDPDGRNRLNINLFTGDVYVTDFSQVPPLGNMKNQPLQEVFAKWLAHPLYQQVNCYCSAASCCGPNLLVKDMYYQDVDFKKKKALIAKTSPS